MRSVFPFTRLLLIALWLGGGAIMMFVAAPAAFAAAPDRTTAANIVGTMLTRWHYVSLLIPVLLLMMEWRERFPSNARVLFLAAAILLGVTQSSVDLKIRAMRASSPVPISELSANDPLRRRFGVMHGVSSLLMLIQVMAAAGVLWSLAVPPAPPAPAPGDVLEL